MADESLPFEIADARPLRIIYLDLNAYFATVEQQVNPSLRGRPVAVGAIDSDAGTIIAASYEAKRFGVKTGTRVGDAKIMCPDLVLVHGDHKLYTKYHQLVLEAVDTVLPVESVNSIDEMHFRLIGEEQMPQNALSLAEKLKGAIQELAGECLTCSIGIAPNRFLAKLGTDMQKPNGLVMIEATDLPDKICGLDLAEFAGINRRMKARIQAAGIFDSTDLTHASKEQLRKAFGSVVGERWWYLLRGYELVEDRQTRKSLGHSHVLPPNLRTEEGARQVLVRLTTKACARMRDSKLWATRASIYVRGRKKSWESNIHLPGTNDSVGVTQEVLKRWSERDFDVPIAVGITFHELHEQGTVTPSLFEPIFDRHLLNDAVDSLNRKFGKNTIFLGGMIQAKDTASERIAFQKTELFSEGKGDNEIT